MLARRPRWGGETVPKVRVMRITDRDPCGQNVTIVFSPPYGGATVDRKYLASREDFCRLLGTLFRRDDIVVDIPRDEGRFRAWLRGKLLEPHG